MPKLSDLVWSTKLTPIVLGLRAAILIAAAAFLTAETRDYLASRWDLPISPQLYGLMAFLLIGIVGVLSTRRLFRELRLGPEVPRQFTTKLTPLLLGLRAAAFIALAAFLTIEGRDYLASRWDLPISPQIYGVLAFLFIGTVASLSMQRFLRELRADADFRLAQQAQVAARQLKGGEGSSETVHKYPWLLRWFLAFFGLIFVAAPYLSADPGKPIAIATYVVAFVIAFVFFATALYMSIYSVTIKHDGIVINAFRKREIAFPDVKDSKVVWTQYGRIIVVRLKDGEVFRFGGRLTDFSTLWGALSAQTPARTD
ncbi:MAG TPA: hypothetical protein VEY94_08335 [Patescibacteria group bacterium]|nr:hypothetical protein [Patescibacteria group bacterium]